MGPRSILAIISLIIGVVTLAGSVYTFIDTNDFLLRSVRAEGYVVEIDKEKGTRFGSALPSPLYYRPVVRFTTDAGESVEFTEDLFSGTPLYHAGQRLPVLYIPDVPGDAKIEDFHSLWGMTATLAIAGVINLVIFSVIAFKYEKVKRYLEGVERLENGFDPRSLGDPIALRTQWTSKPVSEWDPKYKWLYMGPDRIEIRATPESLFVCLLFPIIGLPFLAIFIVTDAVPELQIPCILIGVIITIFSMVELYKRKTPMVFDKASGWFWKGRKDPGTQESPTASNAQAPIEDIHALQLLSRQMPLKRKGDVYYLNLVLKDGQRIHITAQKDFGSLEVDVGALAQFLGVPVWNAA